MENRKKATNKKSISILVGTRKGAFVLKSSSERSQWKQTEPIFLGHIIHHFLADRRTPGVMLMAAKTGHLGPTVFRSVDGGTTFTEATKPPAFPTVEEGQPGRVVKRVFWLTQGHDSEPGVWYAGTAPAGLFVSRDNGDTWESVEGFNDNPHYVEWATQGETPDGQFLHSILIDPRDPDHMYLGISIGGCFESTDRGKSWAPLNKGVAADFLPNPDVEFGHDPHCIVYHPANPDRLYQQNHCGIYMIDRPSTKWERIGRNMPEEIGDIGFPIVPHPSDINTAWVFPMDGTEVWPRTSPDGKPAVYATTDGGLTWKKRNKGLPAKHAYFTVKRQAMTADSSNPVGIYFGTTSGEIWGSNDEGKSWECIARHLPEVYSLEVLEN